MLRVVDRVDETTDREESVEDWSLLATPLSEVIKVEATEDISALYIKPSASNKHLIVSAIKDVDQVRTLPVSIIDVRAKLTTHRSKPAVLVGEAGVGKTAWLSHFHEEVLKKDDRFITFRYDQKVDFHTPLGKKFDPKEKFEKLFWYKTIDTLQDKLRERGITGTRLSSIVSEEIIEYSDPQLLKLYKVFSEEVKKIHEEKGFMFFALIDNLDQFDAELQKRAFELSVWLGALHGVNSFVTLRPDTMNDHLFIENVHNPTIYQILPPSLKQLIDSRLNYLWSDAGQDRLVDVRNLLENQEITINLSYTGLLDRSEKALKTFHKNIGHALYGNSLLEDALYSLHNYNIREVSIILSSIVLTRYFSGEFKEGTAEEPIPHLKKPEKLVTAYLRGMYGHYRPGTKTYPVADISLFGNLTVPPNSVMLGVRILQILMNRKSANDFGVGYKELLSTLSHIGYGKDSINRYLCMLLVKGFVAESARQAKITDSSSIEDSDRFRLQPTGEFVLNKLLLGYAFRYCEAVADICPHPRPDGKDWATDKSFLSMSENALGILELFIASAEYERSLSEKKDVDSNSNNSSRVLRLEFYRKLGNKDEILQTMVNECIGRVKFFSKQSSDTRKNYDAVTEFRVILENRVPKIQNRVLKLNNFS